MLSSLRPKFENHLECYEQDYYFAVETTRQHSTIFDVNDLILKDEFYFMISLMLKNISNRLHIQFNLNIFGRGEPRYVLHLDSYS